MLAAEEPQRHSSDRFKPRLVEPGRLLRRTFLFALILVSGGLITSSALELFFRYRDNLDNIEVLQREIARGAAFKIHSFVIEIEKTMKALAQTQDLMRPAVTKAYRVQLFKILKGIPSITTVVAVALDGREQIKVSQLQRIQEEELRDRSSAQAFLRARRGESFFSPVYFAEQSEPYMRIAVPIERFGGDVDGVLIADVNLKYIWEVISGIKVGQTGYAYVVSQEGELIAHTAIGLVHKKQTLMELGQVRAALVGFAVPFVTHLNLAGQRVYPAYAAIPELGWAVLIEWPAQEIYSQLYPSVIRTSTLLFLGFGLALLASLLLARRVIRPLNALREGAEQIGRGDLDSHLDLKTGDEFEIVAEEFNKMTAALRKSYTCLEQKVAERTRTLLVANQNLADASKHKSQFLANVNHELRTPVSAIISYARLVLRKTEGQISEGQRENLQDLLKTAERLLQMIDSLLDLAKIEAGRMEVRVEPVRIDELIYGAAANIEPILKQDHVRLVREIESGLPSLNTDREKLRQIILNLLGNAAKFTEKGEIKISALQQDGSMTLAVSDTGIGIEEKDLSHIFDEFRQGDVSNGRKYGGAGLGLAIVKRFLDLLGGDIAVNSEVGKGSTFTVTLPLDDPKKVSGTFSAPQQHNE